MVASPNPRDAGSSRRRGATAGGPRGAAAPRRVRRVVVFLAVVAIALVLYAAFTRGGGLNALRPTPTFASVESTPDPSLRGTVAYNALAMGTPQGKVGCVDAISVGGGPVISLFCADQPKAMGAQLKWLADGRLEATDQYAARWRKIVDLATRDVTTLPGVSVPTTLARDTVTVPGPGGERVTSAVRAGSLVVTLITPTQSRSLLDVKVPPQYSINDLVWSPDGRWIVAEDSAARLLVISTNRHPTTRTLVIGGWGPAVTTRTFAERRP